MKPEYTQCAKFCIKWFTVENHYKENQNHLVHYVHIPDSSACLYKVSIITKACTEFVLLISLF